LNDWDAVVSSLGTGLSPFREVSLLTVATRVRVTAMTRNGVRRLVCITALGVGDSRGHGDFVFEPAVPAFAAQPCLMTVRKPRSAPGHSIGSSSGPPCSPMNQLVGSVRAVTDLAGVQGGKIARADVARFVVEQLTTDTWLRRTPVILW
jgi:hypothetical protein